MGSHRNRLLACQPLPALFLVTLRSILRFSLPLRLRHRSQIDSGAAMEARRTVWEEESPLIFSLSTLTSNLSLFSTPLDLSKLLDPETSKHQKMSSNGGGDTYTPKCVLVTGQSLFFFLDSRKERERERARERVWILFSTAKGKLKGKNSPLLFPVFLFFIEQNIHTNFKN